MAKIQIKFKTHYYKQKKSPSTPLFPLFQLLSFPLHPLVYPNLSSLSKSIKSISVYNRHQLFSSPFIIAISYHRLSSLINAYLSLSTTIISYHRLYPSSFTTCTTPSHRTQKKGVPEASQLPGPLTLKKEGGFLLSRIALQYHRRKWA